MSAQPAGSESSTLAQRIYVGNLSYESEEASVRELFASYGEVLSVSLPTDRQTGRPRGFGFIDMSSEDAAKAIQALDGTDFGGRTLNVSEARPRGEGGRGRGGGYGAVRAPLAGSTASRLSQG